MDEVADRFGGLGVLVNHAGTQGTQSDLRELGTESFDRTVKMNLHGPFWITRAALGQLRAPGAIIDTGSVNGLCGNTTMVGCAASKSAVHTFTSSLVQQLARSGVRVNCVAPGPVWIPLIPSTFTRRRRSRASVDAPVTDGKRPAPRDGRSSTEDGHRSKRPFMVLFSTVGVMMMGGFWEDPSALNRAGPHPTAPNGTTVSCGFSVLAGYAGAAVDIDTVVLVRAGVDPMTRDESARGLARSFGRFMQFVLFWWWCRVVMGAAFGSGN